MDQASLLSLYVQVRICPSDSCLPRRMLTVWWLSLTVLKWTLPVYWSPVISDHMVYFYNQPYFVTLPLIIYSAKARKINCHMLIACNLPAHYNCRCCSVGVLWQSSKLCPDWSLNVNDIVLSYLGITVWLQAIAKMGIFSFDCLRLSLMLTIYVFAHPTDAKKAMGLGCLAVWPIWQQGGTVMQGPSFLKCSGHCCIDHYRQRRTHAIRSPPLSRRLHLIQQPV